MCRCGSSSAVNRYPGISTMATHTLFFISSKVIVKLIIFVSRSLGKVIISYLDGHFAKCSALLV